MKSPGPSEASDHSGRLWCGQAGLLLPTPLAGFSLGSQRLSMSLATLDPFLGDANKKALPCVPGRHQTNTQGPLLLTSEGQPHLALQRSRQTSAGSCSSAGQADRGLRAWVLGHFRPASSAPLHHFWGTLNGPSPSKDLLQACRGWAQFQNAARRRGVRDGDVSEGPTPVIYRT